MIILLAGDLPRFAHYCRTQPELGRLVKWIFFPSFTFPDEDDFGTLDDALAERSNLVSILSRCHSLQRVGYQGSFWESFVNFYFDWNEFVVLVSTCGQTLVDLQIALFDLGLKTLIHNPTLLFNLTSLRNLCLRSEISFNVDCMELPETAFCTLETLACWSRDDTFLRLMAQLGWVDRPLVLRTIR